MKPRRLETEPNAILASRNHPNLLSVTTRQLAANVPSSTTNLNICNNLNAVNSFKTTVHSRQANFCRLACPPNCNWFKIKFKVLRNRKCFGRSFRGHFWPRKERPKTRSSLCKTQIKHLTTTSQNCNPQRGWRLASARRRPMAITGRFRRRVLPRAASPFCFAGGTRLCSTVYP